MPNLVRYLTGWKLIVLMLNFEYCSVRLHTICGTDLGWSIKMAIIHLIRLTKSSDKKMDMKNTLPPAVTKFEKAIFSSKVKVKVIKLLIMVHLKGHQLSMHIKYEISICNGSKVVVKVKVDNRRTNRQDKNNIPLIIRSGESKMLKKRMFETNCPIFCIVMYHSDT